MAETAAPTVASAQELGATLAAVLAAALELHGPVRRYKASFRDTTTYPTALRAFEVNFRDPMCGFESIPLGRPEEAEFVVVCAECFRIANAAYAQDDECEHDDALDGSTFDTSDVLWPCPTMTAIAQAAGASPAAPKD